MAQKEIRTAITIKASPSKVWNILTDFENYPNWNPFILSLTGNMQVGNTISIKLSDMSFKPTLLTYETDREMRWKGKLLFKGIFDGEHIFKIKDNKDGTVTFHHNEIFNGILVGMFSKKLDTDTRAGFEAMNVKLKELAEA